LARLFIRIELRGSPSREDHENLHAYMEKKTGTERSKVLPEKALFLTPCITVIRTMTYPQSLAR
jgi:hypothetical protein